VVVYKIDRLSRSLMDFTKLVEVFDRHDVTFVSVTQSFNTTTSMGRLTLNVLLSFAQFEREITSERLRDKVAASKKKGLWMGGYPVLGYDIKDHKLVVNQAEAKFGEDLGLKAFVTGLPTWYLLNPSRATAQDLQCAINAKANLQYLIVSTSSNGDPLNCNCPGTYEGTGAGVVHHRRDRDVHQRRVDDQHEHRHRQQDGEPLVAGLLVGDAGGRVDPYASAFALRDSYSAWLMAPLSSSCLAFAISSVELAGATDRMWSSICCCAAC
jgi:hypothetical protein